MKLKLTSRSFIYIAILIIVFYYGVKFMGTLTEGYRPSGMSGTTPTNEKCGFGLPSCSNYCGKITDSKGNKFDTGFCSNNRCFCGTKNK